MSSAASRASGPRLGDPDGHGDRAREVANCVRTEQPQALGDRQRPRLAGAREHERELLAAEPRRHVALARCGPQHVGEAPQHLVAGVVAERVVDALEVVEVAAPAATARRPAERVEVGVDARLEAAAVAQAGERVVLGEVAQAVELARGLDRADRLVGERPQRLQRSSARAAARSPGSSAHTMPASAPSRSCSGTTSQWWFQARGPRPLLTDE